MITLRRFGFSLTELTVVMAILAFLLGLLAPALAGARSASQATASLANLRLLGQMHASYANQHQDALVNPFGPELGPRHWRDMLLPSTTYTDKPRFVPFADPTGRDTEFFGVIAATVLVHESEPTGSLDRVSVSPMDAPVLKRRQASGSRRTVPADGGDGESGASGGGIGWLVDSSYYFSPTLWLKPARYSSGEAIVSANAVRWWRRNRTDQVLWPAAKAMAVERFDFLRRVRASGSWRSPRAHREAGPPMFNNIDATTRLVALDGHAESVRMARLYDMAGNLAGPTAYAPSGLWTPGISAIEQWGLQADGLQVGNIDERPSGPFLNFFWGTRAGIAGRDLP